MKIPGVESADVSLNKGLATVKLKPGNNILPSELWEAIRKNGNTPKVTRVTVRGEVRASGNQLKVSGTNEMFALNAPPPLAEQLKAAVVRTLTIEGTLTPGKDAKAAVPLELQDYTRRGILHG
jgi:hypothetical protein